MKKLYGIKDMLQHAIDVAEEVGQGQIGTDMAEEVMADLDSTIEAKIGVRAGNRTSHSFRGNRNRKEAKCMCGSGSTVDSKKG